MDEVVGTGGAVYSIGAVAANGHHVECHTVGPVGYKMAKAQIVHTEKRSSGCHVSKVHVSKVFSFGKLQVHHSYYNNFSLSAHPL